METAIGFYVRKTHVNRCLSTSYNQMTFFVGGRSVSNKALGCKPRAVARARRYHILDEAIEPSGRLVYSGAVGDIAGHRLPVHFKCECIAEHGATLCRKSNLLEILHLELTRFARSDTLK